MAPLPVVSFAKPAIAKKGTVVLLTAEKHELNGIAKEIIEATDGHVERAFKVKGFKSTRLASLEVVAPVGLGVDRLVFLGLGDPSEMTKRDWSKVGGAIAQKVRNDQVVSVVCDIDGLDFTPENAAQLGFGLTLGTYRFDMYKTPKDKKKPSPKPAKVTIAHAESAKANKLFKALAEVASGVVLARRLVCEPPNELGPVEFANEAEKLKEQGVDVEILDVPAMEKLGMRALLGVGQGSERPSRIAIMKWNGGKASQKPVALVGKGVVFDTGGISIKPSAGMEDMKGDMGGAAAVIGAMRAISGRKAKANVIGVLGLVENMPDGKAQRPGDIVKAMSGTTIEIINTDAEGRLVLADALWHTQEEFDPAVVIDLATLTGACMVALGSHNAGLFSNSDELALRLAESGAATGEGVWRLPLSAEYDKMIDSKFADVKNSGGRWAGATTAAQFLQRFIKDGQSWAHLDIAGTALGSPDSEISKGWSSGFGVQLLNEFVARYYE